MLVISIRRVSGLPTSNCVHDNNTRINLGCLCVARSTGQVDFYARKCRSNRHGPLFFLFVPSLTHQRVIILVQGSPCTANFINYRRHLVCYYYFIVSQQLQTATVHLCWRVSVVVAACCMPGLSVVSSLRFLSALVF